MRRAAVQAVLAVSIGLALWYGGRHTLPAPPLIDPGAVGKWWNRTGPLTAAFGVMRTGLLGLSAGWVLVTLLAVVPATRRWGIRIANVAEVVGGERPRLRSGLRLVLGLSAAGISVGGCATRGSGAASAPVLAELGPVSSTVPGRVGTAAVQPAPAVTVPDKRAPVMRPPGSTAAPVELPAGPAAPAAVPAAPAVPPAQWVVRPGDCLWSIAAATLNDPTDPTDPTPVHPPAARAVADYWLQVVQANRSRLADPDLIFPGDVVALPPIPQSPAH